MRSQNDDGAAAAVGDLIETGLSGTAGHGWRQLWGLIACRVAFKAQRWLARMLLAAATTIKGACPGFAVRQKLTASRGVSMARQSPAPDQPQHV